MAIMMGTDIGLNSSCKPPTELFRQSCRAHSGAISGCIGNLTSIQVPGNNPRHDGGRTKGRPPAGIQAHEHDLIRQSERVLSDVYDVECLFSAGARQPWQSWQPSFAGRGSLPALSPTVCIQDKHMPTACAGGLHLLRHDRGHCQNAVIEGAGGKMCNSVSTDEDCTLVACHASQKSFCVCLNPLNTQPTSCFFWFQPHNEFCLHIQPVL